MQFKKLLEDLRQLNETLEGASVMDLTKAKEGIENKIEELSNKANSESQISSLLKTLKSLEDILNKSNVTESMNEISYELADDVNTKRQMDAVKKTIEYKKTGSEEDRKIAKEAKDLAKKNNELFKKWKKSKGIKESKDKKIVVASFDNGKHQIIKCKEGYYNRYNIKEGKARIVTGKVNNLPTAIGALKKRFPESEQDK